MDVNSMWISIAALVVSIVSAFIALISVVQTKKLQREQWLQDELELRRDVLRRLCAYRHRLTESGAGQGDEPFIALNEAWVVFANHSTVVDALREMRVSPNQSSAHIVSIIKAMAEASNISLEGFDEVYLEYPFVPGEGMRLD